MSHIFDGLQPSKMAARPCAAQVPAQISGILDRNQLGFGSAPLPDIGESLLNALFEPTIHGLIVLSLP